MKNRCAIIYDKAAYYWQEKAEEPYREKFIFLIILSSSILFRLFYIDYISVYDIQHDVGTPYENHGHLGYISYLLQKGHLPDFDVREAFQFWHPPLHHIISAVFLSLVWFVFPGQMNNYESIQILPVIYISVCIWLIWKLLRLWNIQGKALTFVTLIIAFHPTFIMLSGSVNNDALCVLFTLLSVYLSILWYRRPTYKLIIGCAVSIGLGMSTKGMAAVAAFPMAFLFLMGLIKNKKKVIGQLALFGMLALPLGLWWYIRNYLAFEVPVNYIYRTSTDAIGYLGDIPIWKRVLDFDIRRFSFSNIYIQFEGKFTEINPIIALLKSEVYGQFWFNYNIYIRIVAYPLIFIWLFLVLLSMWAVPCFIRKNREYMAETVSMIILFAVQFVSYYSFCISYPFVWTMDIRYAVPLLACHCLFLGEFIRRYPAWGKIIKWASILFVLLTTACFVMLSFTSFS